MGIEYTSSCRYKCDRCGAIHDENYLNHRSPWQEQADRGFPAGWGFSELSRWVVATLPGDRQEKIQQVLCPTCLKETGGFLRVDFEEEFRDASA